MQHFKGNQAGYNWNQKALVFILHEDIPQTGSLLFYTFFTGIIQRHCSLSFKVASSHISIWIYKIALYCQTSGPMSPVLCTAALTETSSPGFKWSLLRGTCYHELEMNLEIEFGILYMGSVCTAPDWWWPFFPLDYSHYYSIICKGKPVSFLNGCYV